VVKTPVLTDKERAKKTISNAEAIRTQPPPSFERSDSNPVLGSDW